MLNCPNCGSNNLYYDISIMKCNHCGEVNDIEMFLWKEFNINRIPSGVVLFLFTENAVGFGAYNSKYKKMVDLIEAKFIELDKVTHYIKLEDITYVSYN